MSLELDRFLRWCLGDAYISEEEEDVDYQGRSWQPVKVDLTEAGSWRA